MENTKEQLVKFNQAFIGYKNLIIFKNLNLKIHVNEKIFIIGTSGSGKSTILHSLLDDKLLLQGKIEKTHTFNAALLSQDSLLLENESVYKNIKYSLMNYKNFFYKFFNIITKHTKMEIINILSDLNILDKIFYRVSDLSGGEKQRVEIAILKLKKVNCILADEPTTSLDIGHSQKIIANLLKESIAVIINVHKLNLIPVNHRVLCLKNGQIIFDGFFSKLTTAQIKNLYE